MITTRLQCITMILAITTLSAFAQPPPSTIDAASAHEVDAFILAASDATVSRAIGIDGMSAGGAKLVVVTPTPGLAIRLIHPGGAVSTIAAPQPGIAANRTAALSAQTLYWVMESDRSGNPFAVLPCDLPFGPSNVNWNILCTRRGTPPFSYNVAKNDMIVSRASARHPEFQELFGVWKNHSTVGECGRMRDVIQFILGSDPLAGGAPSSVTCPNP